MTTVHRPARAVAALSITLHVSSALAQSALPSPPPPPPSASPPLVRVYGFVRPTVAYANSAVESYGRPNASAPTSAANPVATADVDNPALSFQVAQSRVGLSIGEGGPVRAKLELDFIDFGRASPTVAALPRLRIASVEWAINPQTSIFAGQMWDVVAPLMPHHNNVVGANFQAGNLGFMRQQLGVRRAFGPVEARLAVGLPGSNNGPTLTDLEFEGLPTFAASFTWRPSTSVMLGASGLATQLRFGQGHEQVAGVGAIDVEVTAGPMSLRAEGYVGQNAANLGMLTLGLGRADVNVQEAGGWLSAKVTFAQIHAVHFTAGAASVLAPSTVAAGYARATPAAAPARNYGSPGIEWNAAARLGYALTPVQGLTFSVEPYLFATRHHLDAVDASTDPTRLAWGAELNTLYAF